LQNQSDVVADEHVLPNYASIELSVVTLYKFVLCKFNIYFGNLGSIIKAHCD